MSRARFALLAVAAGCAGTGRVRSVAQGGPEPVTVHAAAPDGTGTFSLGQAYSARMTPLGVTVFANDAAHLRRADVNRFQHESLSVDDQQSLAANAEAWHVASASLSADATERYATHRAFQITHTLEVDASELTADPPPGAVYYLARIAFGHLYEEVVHGRASTFHAGLSAEFTRAASGSIEAWARANRLQMEARGIGMAPTGGAAIFARTSEEVQRGYTTTGAPVPIFVDFRTLPTVAAPGARPIAWTQPLRMRVLIDNIDVYRNGSLLGSARWSMGAGCTVDSPAHAQAEPVLSESVTDSGQSGVAGPRGTRTFHRYEIQWSRDLDVVPGNEVQCGLVGSQDGVPIQYSGFVLTVGDRVEPQQAHFRGLDGNTEYWVNYRVVAGR